MAFQKNQATKAFNDTVPIEPVSPWDYDFWQLIEGLPVAIYTCNLDGCLTYYNEAAVELWGRSPELGKEKWCGSWKIYRTDGTPLPLDTCPMAVTLKEGRSVKGEEVIVERPDGKRIYVLPQPKPLYDEHGKMTGAINMLVDITAKREAEQIIRENESKHRTMSQLLEEAVEERTATLKISEERYHKMVEEVQDYAILLLDKEGFILNWNIGAEKIKGYTEKEIIGKNFRIFYPKEDRESGLPEKLISEAAQNGRAMHAGWRLRKDGTRFWGSIVITALHDEHSNIIGYSKVTRDLTIQKLAEDQLKEYTNELEFQNKRLEEYAHVASHDLQEPLRKIKTFISLIMRNIDDKAELKKNVDKINAAAIRMETLIQDVLRYSQLTRSDDLFVATDLNKVFENVIEDYDLIIQQKKATIVRETLPVIKGIPIQLHQLFSNLISNSLKFTNRTPVIEISVKKIENAEIKKYPLLSGTSDYVKIIFKDNGMGFDPEYAEQVFKLFQRLSTSKYGTGIGLAVCKKIVENHKGFIRVSSASDEGAIFDIFLPLT